MAKAYGSRPGSRTGPQDVAAAGRTTRSTRSQSREPSEPPLPARPAKKGSKKQNAAATIPEELEPVEEAPTVEERLRDELIAENAASAENMQHSRQASVLSDRTATSAKTSFSIEEIADLDPEVIIDVMKPLASAANDLAKFLVPSDPRARAVIRKEIMTEGTKHYKLHLNRVGAIQHHKKGFGSTEYIQPSIVLRALFGVQSMREVPQGPWRPDNIIYAINLATMLNNVLILQGDSGPYDYDTLDLLSDLDIHFGSAIAGPIFDERAFQLCLSILRQLCIARIALSSGNAGYEPRTLVETTFYIDSQDKALVFKHGNVLHTSDLEPESRRDCENMVQNSASEFIDAFAQVSPTELQEALESFRHAYPWEQFLEQVVDYYLARNQDLENAIAAVGGIDEIKSGLEEEVTRRDNARAADGIRASFSRPSTTPKKRFGKGGIKALKAREKQLTASAAASTAAAALAAAPATAPVAQMTDPALDQETGAIGEDLQHIEDIGEAVAADSVTRSAPPKHSVLPALATLKAAQAQAAAKEKGKARLIDRQEGAQRVQWDEFGSQVAEYAAPPTFQQPGSAAQGPYYQSPQRSSSKRPHAAIIDEDVDNDVPLPFDPSQDEGFENDTRDPAAADARRRQAPQPLPQLEPRPSTSANPTPPIQNDSPRAPKIQRRNPGSSIPVAPPPFDPDDDFVELPATQRFHRAKIAARHVTITNTQRKPTQVRTPWSDDEENALIELIERLCDDGIHYAALKKIDEANGGGRLARRSAEDMRFKARNMKVTMLKGRTPLPKNFEYIALDKKAQTQLHNLNIEYFQPRIRGQGVVEDE